VEFNATIDIRHLSGNAPVFTAPQSIYGVQEGTTWNPRDGILLGGTVEKNQRIIERFDQPAPTVGELRAAPRVADGQYDRWLHLPGLPKYVVDLVATLTAGKQTPYDKARALSDYFADPNNNFFYSLKTQPGDSGSALVDFLKNREGYCQQYAAALGVMLRQAGIPARIVLGYMHNRPDRAGNFDVSTVDAHAWVEAYFAGVGWVPFDPTPASGLTGGKDSDLEWAPHQYPKGPDDRRPTTSQSARSSQASSSGRKSSSAPAVAAGGGNGSSTPLWVIAGLIAALAIALVPAGVRTGRRRRRYHRARHGDPDALWAEVSDTAVDLGYRWSATRSPRQVAAWLGRDAGTSAPALDRLAAAVERWHYAPAAASAGGPDGGGLVQGWDDVAGALRARRPWALRMRAVLWPASLNWTPQGRRFRLRRH
jgi:hypothetical protein